jgi:hypothetical protein
MTAGASIPPGYSARPDWDTKIDDRKNRESELLPGNKDALFNALDRAGIAIVTVSFDGYGDSGQIEDIQVTANDGSPAKLPEGVIEFAQTSWNNPEIGRSSVTIHDAIENMVYAFLGETHHGWEDSEGAFGEFTFDTANRTISLDYNERYTESVQSEHQF